MRRLIYRSRAAGSVDLVDLDAIGAASIANNPARGVTGFLLHFDDHFLQFVEGPHASIEALMETLAHDPRHSDIEILYDKHGDTRLFGAWDMKHLISFGGTPAMTQLERTLDGSSEGADILAIVRRAVSH